MGASAWHYVTPWLGSPQRSLDALHREVFTAEGWDEEYDSLEELWADEEFMGEQGTHSVLDVPYAVEDGTEPADLGTLRPLPPPDLAEYFGTERPTVEQYTRVLAGNPRLRTEVDDRWTGIHVLLHTDGEPTHMGFFGVSGD
ncbi:hypothetical protein [Kitasatospora phosalacinea]|uniref:Uncharacterized protein n=1 Tax=Kitasatospora phosalacinea TaxID=2065 RepID=A0A9W6PEN1_9ACTN|nr:hypothetical protein [Kitasatospora phosalacinea]GLW53680.1 hypothetical protein Kpho01_16910 [Kitasatospora phosalacinea]